MEYSRELPKKASTLMQLGHVSDVCLIPFIWQLSRFVNHLLFVRFQSLFCLLKLLEAIGAISKTEAKKAASRGGNYQDSATAPLSRDHDDDAAAQEDVNQEESISLLLDTSANILPAVEKVSSSFIRMIKHASTC